MKINQKFAKKAMIVASLTMGVVGYNSMFNEVQAKIDDVCDYNYEDCCTPQGTNVGSCVAKTNGDCKIAIECKYK